MSIRVRIGEQQFETLRDALARPEEVVFAYAAHEDDTLEINVLETMTATDIESQSSRHVVLVDEVRPRLIKTAWDRDQSLIEAHSHGPHGRAEFSASDLLGFEDWVPHVLWRLPGRPYAALVVAGESWDALAWIGPTPIAVAAIDITKSGTVIDTLETTNATAARLARRGRA